MKPLWSFQQRSPFLTGVVSTAGNVAFVGDFDRVFRAVDVTNGKTLWKTRLGTTVQGYPVSFSVDGKQYIAVTTGLGGGSPQQKPHHADAKCTARPTATTCSSSACRTTSNAGSRPNCDRGAGAIGAPNHLKLHGYFMPR